MPRIENEDFISYNRFFLSLTYHTLQYQTSSDSYTISDEKAKYQDFYHHQLLKHEHNH